MNLDLVRSLQRRARIATANPRSAMLVLILVIVMPGGFLVPACYAVYHAIRQSLTK
jgi:hypothetical protein